MKVVTIISAGLLLAGCQAMNKQQTAEAPTTATNGYTCNADDLQHLVGFSESDVVLESLPGPVRILRPNAVATMDMRPDRINLHTDEIGAITRVSCG